MFGVVIKREYKWCKRDFNIDYIASIKTKMYYENNIFQSKDELLCVILILYTFIYDRYSKNKLKKLSELEPPLKFETRE